MNTSDQMPKHTKFTFSRKWVGVSSLVLASTLLLSSFQNCGGSFQGLDSSEIPSEAGFSDPVVTGNKVPVVNIMAPATNTNLIASNVFSVTANASDVDGTIARVELYIDGTRVDQDNSFPYLLEVEDLFEGTYTFAVRAVDNRGGYTQSVARVVNVVIDPLTTPLSTCYADNYVLPGWNNAADVTLSYVIGLEDEDSQNPFVDSTYSPRPGSRPVAGVDCNRISGPETLAVNCNASRIRITTATGVECVSGTVVIEARPDDGCPDKITPPKKFTVNYTNICPDEKIIKAALPPATSTNLDTQTQAQFGARVAKDGNTVVMSAPGYDLMSSDGTTILKQDVGAAYVYEKNTSTGAWDIKARLLPDNAVASDNISAVAVYGNLIALGAPGSAGSGAKGNVYIYEKNASAAWVLTATIKSPSYVPLNADSTPVYQALYNATDVLSFGFHVRIGRRGDVFVGAYGEDLAPAADATSRGNAGAIYRFAKVNGAWAYKQKITATSPIANEFFGYNFSTDMMDQIVVSAPIVSNRESATLFGAAYIFNAASDVYTQTRRIQLATSTVGNMQFGSSIHAYNDVLAVGAPQRDSQKGGVYLFNILTGAQIGPVITPTDIAVDDQFGSNVQITSIANGKVEFYASSPGNPAQDKLGFIYKFEQSLTASATTAATQKFKLRARRAERALKSQFGKSFVVSGSEIAVGSPARFTNNLNNAGVGFVIATPQ